MVFSQALIANADLQLQSRLSSAAASHLLTPEQAARRLALYDLLLVVLESAYTLLHPPVQTPRMRQIWVTWACIVRDWCTREDFRAALSELLHEAEPQFAGYMLYADDGGAGNASRPKGHHLTPLPDPAHPQVIRQPDSFHRLLSDCAAGRPPTVKRRSQAGSEPALMQRQPLLADALELERSSAEFGWGLGWWCRPSVHHFLSPPPGAVRCRARGWQPAS
ncbi:hypothetical protein [Deinococcus sp. QL22]|uniref:hypothetical protein n=1 Tax=Deinococcus sp. QL22 TaxID=2939437 RepID=UPI002016BD46|nr:hypothetical protein [Deinococcus sp. QL22]UQN09373.1 hypothetical protein M1R55_22705 [Deinococcus sp. QL22]